MEIVKNTGFHTFNEYYVKKDNEYYRIESAIDEKCAAQEIPKDDYEYYKKVSEESGVAVTKDDVHYSPEDVEKVEKETVPRKVKEVIEEDIL